MLQAAAGRYDVADSARNVRTYGQDPGAFSLALSLFPLIAIGRFDEARQAIQAAQEIVEQAGHPMTRAAARTEAALGNIAGSNVWFEKAWAATQATGSHCFAALSTSDALQNGLPEDPWQSRLADVTRHVSLYLPLRPRDFAERFSQ